MSNIKYKYEIQFNRLAMESIFCHIKDEHQTYSGDQSNILYSIKQHYLLPKI